jgi:hypothetical protein
MASPMPDFDELTMEVPPVCNSWPGCEGTSEEFDIDRWCKMDSTCNWPNCFAEGK